MIGLMYIVLISVFILTYIFEQVGGTVGRVGALLPEMLTVGLAVGVLVHGAHQKKIYIHTKYIVLGMLYLTLLLVGILANRVEAGAIIAGLRVHLRFIPFFMLPAVIRISEEDMTRQLKLIGLFAFIQVPVAMYQRFVQYAAFGSGDLITGTLNQTYTLSVFLLGVFAVFWGYYLRRRIGLIWFAVVSVVILLPTTINETHALPLLMIVVIAAPVAVYVSLEKDAKIIWKFSAVIAAFLIGSTLLHGVSTRLDSYNLVDDYLSGRFMRAISKGIKQSETDQFENIGRLDALRFAYENLSRDIPSLMYGIGTGNATQGFTKLLKGRADEIAHLVPRRNSLSYIFWEQGLIGLLLILVGAIFIISDVVRLAMKSGFVGDLALGWVGVTALYVVGLLYANVMAYNAIFLLFWYFSGYFLADKVRRGEEVSGGNARNHNINRYGRRGYRWIADDKLDKNAYPGSS